MSDNDSAYTHVAACTKSEANYTRNCEVVFGTLAENSRTYIKDFVNAIHNVITDMTCSPTQVFLALQLLVNATETNNQILMKRIASSSDLLNRLFHDAQFDYDAPIDEKGTQYFSEKPIKEDIKLGKDYIRLVLESFMYWNKEYGSVNSNDPLHCFYAVFTSLCGKTQLPTSYKFINKNQQVRLYVQKAPRGSHSRSPSPNVSLEPASPRRVADSPGRQSSAKLQDNEAYWQLLKCVPSQESYDKHSLAIFEIVEKPSLDYNKKLLSAVTEIQSNRNHSPTVKFYALYLLAQITETNNKVFVTQLVRESALLNQLYSLAKKKGDTDTAKRNLHTLTLETIKFWHNEFGSPDVKSPFYSFTYLYKTLLDKGIIFPNEFYYLRQNGERPRVETRKVFAGSEGLVDKNDPIMRLVKVYISSGISFRDDSSNIASILIKQSKEKSLSYLQGTLKILNSPETLPNAKFYALYLLLKVAETKNNNFIIALAESKDVLNQFSSDAVFDKNKPMGKKGAKFFSNQPTPDEAAIGSNYLQLLHETIRFLSRNHGSDHPKNVNYAFKAMLDKVQKEITMDIQDYYAGRNLKNIDDKTMKRFEVTPYQGHDAPASFSPVRDRSSVKASTLTLSELDKQLNQLAYTKTVLLMFLQDTKRENMDNADLADLLVQDVINTYKNNVHPHLEHLMSDSQTGLDDYKDTIYREGKVINELEQELLDYKTGKNNFSQLRQNLIPLLTSHNISPTPTPSTGSVLFDNRGPSFEDIPNELRISRLQNSDPGAFRMRSRFTRSPGKTQTELLRPTPLVSEGTLPEFGQRSDDILHRPGRRVGTAHLPNRESLSGIKPLERRDIPSIESIPSIPADNRPSSLKAIEPLEDFGKVLEEKFKAIDLIASKTTANRSSVQGSYEPKYPPSQRSSIVGTNTDIFLSHDRTVRTPYLQQTSLGNISPLSMRNNAFRSEKSAFTSDPLYRPPTFGLETSTVNKFEGIGREPFRDYYMGASKSGSSPVKANHERSYLFSNSTLGNRLGM